MPIAASRPCTKAGCYALQPCHKHYRKPFATAIRSSSLYDTTRWKRERREHLALEPYCRVCGQPATFVDHVIPHRGSEIVFFDRTNWQSLCRHHSNVKTGRETRGRGQ